MSLSVKNQNYSMKSNFLLISEISHINAFFDKLARHPTPRRADTQKGERPFAPTEIYGTNA